MTLFIVLSCLWVLAATGVALLPMRYQYVPGIALLLVAPVLIYLIARNGRLWVAIIFGLAVISMFRKPLRHFLMRAIGG